MTGNSCIALEKVFNTDDAVRHAFGEQGLQRWMDVYHDINHRLWRQYDSGEIDRATLRRERFAQPLQAAGIERSEAVAAAARLDGMYLQYLGDCPACIPGARESVLAMRAAGVPMGIVSNGFREVQYRKLRSGGLEGCFNPIVLSDDTGVNKPDRRFFDAACRAAGVEPTSCIIIGDNARTDILGAIDAGWGAALWYDDGRAETDDAHRQRIEADGRCTRFTDMSLVAHLLGLDKG